MGLFSKVVCDLCDNKIKGTYTYVGDASNPNYRMCNDCKEKLEKSLGDYDFNNGYPKTQERAKRIMLDAEEARRFKEEIMKELEQSAIPCDLCGASIIGDYFEVGEGKPNHYCLCPKCYEKIHANLGTSDIGIPDDKETAKRVMLSLEEARKYIVENNGCICCFEAISASLKAYEDYAVIIRQPNLLDAMTTGIRGDKTIYYSDITAIQYKKPVGLFAGYIQFSIAGGREGTRGTNEASFDENSIVVPIGDDYAIASEKIVDYMQERLRAVKSGKGNTVVNNVAVSSADEILKYKQLLDTGIISQEEFDAKKKQLLGL